MGYNTTKMITKKLQIKYAIKILIIEETPIFTEQ